MSNQEWQPSRYTVSDACPGCGCIVYGNHYCTGRFFKRYEPIQHMPTDPTPVPAPQPSLRKAACEALLAGGLLLSDVQRDSANWQQTCMARTSEERFRKALENLAEALAQ